MDLTQCSYQNVGVATTIAVGPPTVVLMLSPYVLLFVMFVALVTCSVVCVHIVGKCWRRNQSLDAIKNRAIRRANAEQRDGKRGCNCSDKPDV